LIIAQILFGKDLQLEVGQWHRQLLLEVLELLEVPQVR
jgi:hypothetical protein